MIFSALVIKNISSFCRKKSLLHFMKKSFNSFSLTNNRLDRGSIRSSRMYGLSPPDRLTLAMEQCWSAPPVHHVLVYMDGYSMLSSSDNEAKVCVEEVIHFVYIRLPIISDRSCISRKKQWEELHQVFISSSKLFFPFVNF